MTVVATIPRYVQRHTHQTTIPRDLTKALANNKHVCAGHKRDSLLNERKAHAEVRVRRETRLVKMWQVECRLVSCMLQQCSSWQYVYMRQLVIVL